MGALSNFVDRGLGFLNRKGRLIRNFDWAEARDGRQQALEFLQETWSEKTVLLIEPNRFHAEVLPGYCRLFQQLGFKVVILMRRDNHQSGVFSRFPPEERPRCFAMHPRRMRRALGKVNSKCFEFAMLTSAYWSEPHGHFGLFSNYLKKPVSGRFNFGTIVHEFDHLVPNLENNEISLKSLAMLSAHEYRGKAIPEINPNYFGNIVKPPKNNPVVFIAVGNATARNRGFEKLFSAIQELNAKGYQNFKVQIVGREGASRAHFPLAPACVEFLGCLDFPELFDRVEKANFFLPLLDPDNAGHRRYLQGTTTGSRQLILGFCKPAVINITFAKHYGFSSENSIVYSENDLGAGLVRALELSSDEYDDIKSRLAQYQAKVESTSLRNLRKMIELTMSSV